MTNQSNTAFNKQCMYLHVSQLNILQIKTISQSVQILRQMNISVQEYIIFYIYQGNTEPSYYSDDDSSFYCRDEQELEDDCETLSAAIALEVNRNVIVNIHCI